MKPGKAALRSRPGGDAPPADAPATETLVAPVDPWRPLPWHRSVWRRLLGAHAADRLHHALMFTGAPGTGKEHFARALAARLLCATPVPLEPGAGGDESFGDHPSTRACGVCGACASYAIGAHPLFSCLSPAQDKKDIALDDVRELLSRIALSGGAAHPRVALIHPPERLNAAGVNALLKTVEEPPGRLHLLLPVARPGALPATLRSRLQVHRLPTPPIEDVDRWLKTLGVVPSDAQHAEAGHAPLTLLAWTRSGRFERHAAWNETLAQLADGRLTPGGAAGRMTSKDREENTALLDWLEADAHRAWRGSAALNRTSPEGARRARAAAAALVDARQRLGQLNMGATGVVEPLLARRRPVPRSPGA